MRLERISVEAFRSFRDKNQSPLLPERGLCLIKGYNKDTGGSSGSGKTSVALAVAHAFKFAHFPATDLQSYHTDKKMQVELSLDMDGRDVLLKVGKEQSIRVGDEVIKGSATAVQEKLQQLTGFSPDMLRALTYRPQKKPGLFLSMTDSDKKEFLSKLLGLEELEQLAEKATSAANAYATTANFKFVTQRDLHEQAAQSKPVEPVLESTDIYVQNVEAGKRGLASAKEMQEQVAVVIAQLRADLATDESESRKVIDEQLGFMRAQHDEMRAARKPFIPTMRDEMVKAQGERSRLQKRLDELRATEQAERGQLMEQAMLMKTKLQMVNQLAATEPKILAEIAALEAQIAHTEKQSCPTCKQHWTAGGAELYLDELREKHAAKSAELADARDAVLMLDQLREMVRDLEAAAKNYSLPEVAEVEVELEKAKADVAKYHARFDTEEQEYELAVKQEELKLAQDLQALKQKLEAELEQALASARTNIALFEQQASNVNNEVMTALLAFNTAKEDLQKVESRNATLVATYEANKRNYEDLLKRAEKAKADWEEIQAMADREEDFARLVGREGFLGSIFEEVLVEISQETNEYLKALPNVATTTIEFTTENETKKGTVQKKIVPVVMKNGVKIPLEAGLSGGQLTSVELAVDLAVMKVISQRTGKMPGWLILDESFEGHDLPVKEACLEILKKAAEDRLILVVDHATEVKEMFDFFIEVESENDVSTIVGGTE